AAGVALAAALVLEGWAAVDRAAAGAPAGSVTSLTAAAEARPSAAAYSRLARAQARAWDAEGAARSALTASRLAPGDGALAAAARARVQGPSLAALLSAPGRWRVLVRADDAVVADGEVSVEPARVNAAA